MSTNISEAYCFNSTMRDLMINCMSGAKTVLLLPLCTFVLYVGHHRWRGQRTFKTKSYSDIFTYHLVAMEFIWGFGFAIHLCGTIFNMWKMKHVGIYFLFFASYGEAFFHILTSLDWYLAVVHPITYLGLKNSRGIKIRNTGITCIWLLCFGAMWTSFDLSGVYFSINLFCFLTFTIIIIMLCSFSVLCALIRSGPAEEGGEKERVDQLKKRAFHTIIVISSMLWLWFIGVLIAVGLTRSLVLPEDNRCVVLASLSWFNNRWEPRTD